MRKIQGFVNKNELGAGTRGTSLSFDAMRFEALKKDFDLGEMFYLISKNELLFNKIIKQNPSAHNIDGVLDYYNRNFKILMNELNYNENQVFFSADHTSSALYLAAFKRMKPDVRIGVVWIDAHTDMHSPYTTPSGNMHGMTLCIALREDNIKCKKRDLDSESEKKWHYLQNLSGEKKALNYEDLVLVGIRDYEKEEKINLERNSIKHYLVSEARQDGIEECARYILETLKDCEHIYISLDVDSMDPKLVSFGTGTPVNNGFSLEEMKNLVDLLTKSGKKTSFEMVEINPLLDSHNEMATKCLEIIEIVYKNLKNEN